MQNCTKCNGHVIPESGYDHGVYCRQYRCLMCGRYYPIEIVTAQVDVNMGRITEHLGGMPKISADKIAQAKQ